MAHCEAHPNCNSFMYGGRNEEETDLCEIAEETEGTNSWGTNFRFCARQGIFNDYLYKLLVSVTKIKNKLMCFLIK